MTAEPLPAAAAGGPAADDKPGSPREMFLLKLLEVLHRGFTEAREAGYRLGDERLIDLADTFEILPTLVGRPGEEREAYITRLLDEYRDRGGRDFAAVLRQSDREFLRSYYPPPRSDVEPSVDAPAAPPAARAA